MSLVYGTQIPSSISASSSVLVETAGEKPDRSEMRAGQIRDMEAARRDVIYWTQESSHPGVPGALAQAKQRQWERSYKKRRALFTRMYERGRA